MAPGTEAGPRLRVRSILERIAQRPEWLESLGRPLETLPTDLVARSGVQIRKAALAFAAIWAFVLIIAWPVAYAFNGSILRERGFPRPGTEIAVIGLLISLAMAWYASRRRVDRERILSLALGHEVITAGLVSAIAWWAPGDTFRTSLSPICLFLPIYPALAPLGAKHVLTAGLLAATTDVLGWAIAEARGVAPSAPALQMFFAFSTTYLCAFLSILPATIIRRLGREVQEARDMGAYRLGKLIGKGGMGEVYRASHRLLARPAAVKVIGGGDLGELDGESRTRALERFRREAAVAAALTSPHTISLFDFGVTESGTYYYVMELLHGMDLQAMVDRHGPIPPARAIHFLRQTAISLAEAHQFGIVHRDIKPSNIYASRLGLEVDFVKVLDFGVVKVEPKVLDQASLKLSREDVPIGTPAYMAPEGIDGGAALTPASDIYSLGCVAFFILTGDMVFRATSVLQMAVKHSEEKPRVPSTVQAGNGISPELDALVLRCLAKNPEDRPADALALLGLLTPLAQGMPWTPESASEWWESNVPPETDTA
jgi:serine/threonine-protein kinase